jgi:hypothetical protein
MALPTPPTRRSLPLAEQTVVVLTAEDLVVALLAADPVVADAAVDLVGVLAARVRLHLDLVGAASTGFESSERPAIVVSVPERSAFTIIRTCTPWLSARVPI